MKARTVAFLIMSVVCGLSASYLSMAYLKPQNITVLVAVKPIPRGTDLHDYQNLFQTQQFPSTVGLPANYATNLDQLKDRARDCIVKQGMNAGEPLSLDNVVDRKQAGLGWSVRDGYSGLAVKATPESSFFGLLEPDNFVKVINVRKGPNGEKKPTILMKNIRVLAVDKTLDTAPVRERGLPTVITLEVTDDEAKKLRLAQEDGPLTLAIMSQSEGQDRTGDPPLAPVVLKKVVVAQGPIARGTPLGDSKLLFAVKEVPQDQVPDNCVTSLEQLGKTDRLMVVKPMRAGEPLSIDYLMRREPGQTREQFLTILDGSKKRVYALKANGRFTLIESSQTGEEEPAK
jgi:Flp pilus assembly protein CpaB